jgi:hypothetical protein
LNWPADGATSSERLSFLLVFVDKVDSGVVAIGGVIRGDVEIVFSHLWQHWVFCLLS